jgi:phosphoribosylaminoimidazolecarboxamide formyltransferase / IMP cyclohydrolase
MFQRILTSVSDKTGLIPFLSPFVENGAKIVSSGGTAKTLREAGLEVADVSDYTGFPECMDGRVKTLHPKVHMGLLYRPSIEEDLDLLSRYEVMPFDLVVVNLYPFEQAKKNGTTGKDLIEFIDVGGPSMLRAAAKNFENICVVCDPGDYGWIARKDGQLTYEDRKYLAAKVFQWTSTYDQMIAQNFYEEMGQDRETSAPFLMKGEIFSSLRYGENPHQSAKWYRSQDTGLHCATVMQGKALSYNNILDLQSACNTVRMFREPTAVAIKHNNPCSVASDADADLALDKCLKADPVSVFGGIVACNFPVTEKHALLLNEIFLECVIAPEITAEALNIFSEKKNLRILCWKDMMSFSTSHDIKGVDGGLLVQDADKVSEDTARWTFIGEKPSESVLHDLHFAWKTCASLKSNAISVCQGGQTLGLGMGQVNRVDAVRQALGRAQTNHPGRKNLVLASDAFFPFPDSIEIAAKSGVSWIVQPGGSIKDNEVIAKAQELGLQMVLTGQRHFRH